MNDQELKQVRQGKLNRLREMGVDVFPNNFTTSHTIPELIHQYGDIYDSFDGNDVAIAGRIMGHRRQGKSGFTEIQNNGERIQIYVRFDVVGEQEYEIYKLLDLGDHVGVQGKMMRTSKEELTIRVEHLTFLSKALVPMPDKFHGLTDVEARYRQRYVDLFTDNGEEGRLPSRDVFMKRAKALKAIRDYFDGRGFIEAETPMMQPIAGGAAARPFVTHHNTLDMDLYLRIAPELYLKRLVVGGIDRVFEINRNFRNEGISTHHNPEFTMLEFYQAYANYFDMMNTTEELISSVAQNVNGTTLVEFPLKNGEHATIDFAKWTRLSMREAILAYWPKINTVPTEHFFSVNTVFRGVLNDALLDMIDMDDESYLPYKVAFKNALSHAHGDIDNLGSPGKAILTLFEHLVEPNLIQPTIIYDYPLVVSPLSKTKKDEPEWVERFEFFIGGFEIGNAFSELNDATDQENRFKEQVAAKNNGDEEACEMDSDYINALNIGLPPCGGEGIGIDRLVMLLTGSRSIRDVILFPLMRSTN